MLENIEKWFKNQWILIYFKSLVFFFFFWGLKQSQKGRKYVFSLQKFGRFCWNFEVWEVQTYANLVDFGENFRTSIWL